MTDEPNSGQENSEYYKELGNLYKDTNLFDLSIEYYEKGLLYAESHGEFHDLSDFHYRLSNVYKKLNKKDEEINQLLLAIEKFSKANKLKSLVSYYEILGGIYLLHKKSFAEAIPYYEKGLEVASEVIIQATIDGDGDDLSFTKEYIAFANSSIGYCLFNLKELEKSKSYFTKAKSQFEELGNTDMTEKTWHWLNRIERRLRKR